MKLQICACVLVTLVLSFCAIAQNDEPIIIGIDADMSGSASEGGNAIYRGAQIAVDEINRRGGVLNRQLSIEVLDHRGNPARGKRNIRALSENPNIVAILGGVHTPVVLSELELIHQQKIPFLVPWAAGTAIVDNGYTPNYVFRASVRDSEAATVIFNALEVQGAKRVALILERTGWGRSNQASMGVAATERNISIAHIAWINWRQQSFDDEIQQIEAANVDAVVLVTNAPEGAVALTSLLNNEKTQAVPVFSHWGIAAGKFVEKMGRANLAKMDVRVLQTFHFSNAQNQELAEQVLNAYQTQFVPTATKNNIPGKVGLAHAYDLVHMLARAITNANSVDRQNVQTALKLLDSHSGLVKDYTSPFAAEQDALWSSDYIMTKYNDAGFLVPLTRTQD